jgi:hypothetical protein
MFNILSIPSILSKIISDNVYYRRMARLPHPHFMARRKMSSFFAAENSYADA